jgi:hypothetical protein
MAERLVIAAALREAVKGVANVARINHPECPAGTDRKRRLFVAATPGGWYLHCWHCGGEGFISSRLSGRAALDALEELPPAAPQRLSGPAASALWNWGRAKGMWQFDKLGEVWGGVTELRAWINAKNLNSVELRGSVRIKSVSVDCFELRVPIYRGAPPRLVGYQGRQFGPGARKYPKYLTERWEQSDHEPPAMLGASAATPWGTTWRAPRCPGMPAFIVESFADAAYLANLGYCAGALYGADLSDTALLRFTQHPAAERGVIVWLDNDVTYLGDARSDIAEKAQRIAQRFNLYTRAECWLDVGAPTSTTPKTIAEMMAPRVRK